MVPEILGVICNRWKDKSYKWIRFKKVLVVWSLSGVTLNKRSVTIIHRLLESPHPWSRWVSHCDDHVGNLKQQQLHKKEVLPVLTWTGTGYPMKISYVKILLILNLVPDYWTIQVRSLKGPFSRSKKVSKNTYYFSFLWKRVYVGKVLWKGLAALAKERERVISAISCRVIGNPRLKTRCNEHCTLENIAP